jgi:hypothetical protein
VKPQRRLKCGCYELVKICRGGGVRIGLVKGNGGATRTWAAFCNAPVTPCFRHRKPQRQYITKLFAGALIFQVGSLFFERRAECVSPVRQTTKKKGRRRQSPRKKCSRGICRLIFNIKGLFRVALFASKFIDVIYCFLKAAASRHASVSREKLLFKRGICAA